jgi:hypothetical protein
LNKSPGDSFDGWEVDAAVVDEAAARGLIVLTYPGKSGDWWRLTEIGLPRAGKLPRRGRPPKRKGV